MLLLLDNGSLAPAATLSLRRIARSLGERLGREVHPVSLLHSQKIPAEQLEGVPAINLEPFLKRQLEAGVSCFEVIPLFFGPSGALTDYLPERLALLRQRWPGLQLHLAPCLSGQAEEDSPVLARLLADQVRETLADLPEAERQSVRVLMTDHGSPKRALGALRDTLADLLAKELGPLVQEVQAASMERRPEPEYDFNEPLLERALTEPRFHQGTTLISLLFLSPGRHAGPGGDIATICAEACDRHKGLKTRLTPLVGAHPGLIELLAERANGILNRLD